MLFMAELDFDEASERLKMKRSAFEKLIKNGKEISYHKSGRRYVVNENDINIWLSMRNARKVELTKEDFLRALKFALKINYNMHTRSDFGTSRQRPFMQAVENWTQGALAEIALQKFIRDMFNIELQIEFRVFDNAIVGQDIVAVKRNRTINPPRKRISVKSGKDNGMVLIVPVNEIESEARKSDYYVFVRVVFPIDIFARFYRSIPEFEDMLLIIPEFQSIKAYIAGYCKKEELEKRDVPEAGIKEEKYVMNTGSLKNLDNDWRKFVEEI